MRLPRVGQFDSDRRAARAQSIASPIPADVARRRMPLSPRPVWPALMDQHAPAREHLHQPGNDRLQKRVQFIVVGFARVDEARQTIGTARVHPSSTVQ